MLMQQLFRETGRGCGMALRLSSHWSGARGLEEVGSGRQGLWSGPSPVWVLWGILVWVWHSGRRRRW